MSLQIKFLKYFQQPPWRHHKDLQGFVLLLSLSMVLLYISIPCHRGAKNNSFYFINLIAAVKTDTLPVTLLLDDISVGDTLDKPS